MTISEILDISSSRSLASSLRSSINPFFWVTVERSVETSDCRVALSVWSDVTSLSKTDTSSSREDVSVSYSEIWFSVLLKSDSKLETSFSSVVIWASRAIFSVFSTFLVEVSVSTWDQ